MKNETVKDLLKEVRDFADSFINEKGEDVGLENPCATLHEICDRFESAHQREIDELTAAEHGGVIVNGAVRGLKAENDRLRGALKRIAEMSFEDQLDDPYNPDVMNIHDVALEALGVEI